MIHIKGKAKTELSNVQEVDIQPNAIDLRLGKIFKINNNDFIIDEEQKIHRGSEEVTLSEDGYFHLEPGSYEVIMENIINVAECKAVFFSRRVIGDIARSRFLAKNQS
jgi:deoxycytidine triphosphate deaminase